MHCHGVCTRLLIREKLSPALPPSLPPSLRSLPLLAVQISPFTHALPWCLHAPFDPRHCFKTTLITPSLLPSLPPSGLYRYWQSKFPRLLMHCHGVCTHLLTRDKLFQTYIGREKDLCHDYEEDNQALKKGGGGGGGREGGMTTTTATTSMSSSTDGLQSTTAALPPTSSSKNSSSSNSTTPPTSDPASLLLLSQVVIFAGSSLAASSSPPSRGWWRPADHWERRGDMGKPRARPPHLTRMLTDFR